MSGYECGDAVMWRYVPRGGYGYVWPVPAYVVKVGNKRVGIAASKRDGVTVEWVPRWVAPESLAPRKVPS